MKDGKIGNRDVAVAPRSRVARQEVGEDYALRKVPAHFKRTPTSLAMVVSGQSTSVFALAVGGVAALTLGFWSSLLASAICSVIGLVCGPVVARRTATYGVDIDLVSRGSGYGFLGSSLTSLIYAVQFLMYTGLEASFMASAVHAEWPSISLRLLYVLTSLIAVPLNWYGVSQNDWLQRVTAPLFLVGLIYLIAKVVDRAQVVPLSAHAVGVSTLLSAIGMMLPATGGQILASGDYARFMRRQDARKAGWIGPLVVVGLAGFIEPSLGALLSLFVEDSNPGVYAVTILGVIGTAWVVITQLRINNGNYYSASLALANFSSRVLHWTPGRRFWVVAVGLITVVTTELGILNHLTQVLTFVGVLTLGWAGTLLADMVVLRPRGLVTPSYVEHRRGYLKSWGWPSLGSLLVGSVVGGVLDLANIPSTTYGPVLGQILSFSAGFVGPIVTVKLLPRSGRLEARTPEADMADEAGLTEDYINAPENMLTCGSCASVAMRQDMLVCPVTQGGIICSVCCAAHRTCGDVCKQPMRLLPTSG
ncbi:purine-cytosine permease family protein [Streptomyces sp. NPDC001393]